MRRHLVVLIALLMAGTTHAATINVGTHILLPDTANQTIEIYISGTESLLGLNFFGETGEGLSGPLFTAINITGPGTVFAGKTLTDASTLPDHFFEFVASTTVGDEVIANGLLGIITVDTTGLFSGEYDLSLSNPLPSGFQGTAITGAGNPSVSITNGIIKIQGEEVPEPASILLMAGLMACGAPALVMHRRRKRAAANAT